MKTPKLPLNEPDASLEIELARRRAMHHVHDAARILTDAMPYVEAAYRQTYTVIIGGISTLERHLADLAPKVTNKRES